MDVKRYLVFDKDNEYIRISLKKISGDKLIIIGNTREDILKFNPAVVICYQNEDIVDECKKLNKNCIHIYRFCKFHQTSHKCISNLLISPFDKNRIERDDKNYHYNFSMIEDCTDVIANLVSNFKSGNEVLVNPGEILTTEILDFHHIEREARDPINGENRCSISSFPERLKDIKTFFQDQTSWKVNIYLATYHRLEKTRKSLESIIRDVKLSKYDVKIYIGDNRAWKF